MKRYRAVLILVAVCAAGLIASCGESISPAAFKYLTEGEKYFRLMKYDEAIKQYNEAVKAQPSLSQGYLGIGRCLVETGRYDEALRQFKTALDLDPRSDEIVLEIARAYIEGDLDKEAEAMLDKAEELDADHPKLFLYRGIYYFRKGQYKEAVEEFEKSAREDKKSADPYIRLTLLYINAKNPTYQNGEKAVEYAKKAIDRDPSSLAALDALAQAYFSAGRYDLAIETEEAALAKSPDNPILEENLARFQGTVKGSADEHNLKGAQLMEEGDYIGAAEEFKIAVGVDPNFSDGYYNLGKVYSQLKDYDLAKSYYEKAIEISPENPRYHYNLAIVYAAKGMLAESEREYLYAINVDPYYDKAHNNLGALYLKMDKLNEALAEFDKAFEINPESIYKANSDIVKKMMEQRGQSPQPIKPDKGKSQF
jgi:tetratricopeptide (TPR) repeat protein